MYELDLNLGARVLCNDTAGGKLFKVAVDPETHQVTDLIVERGMLLKHSRVVPISTLVGTTPEGILLDVSEAQLEDFTEYGETEISEPASEGGRYVSASGVAPGFGPLPAEPVMVRRRVRTGVSSDRVVLGRDTKVENLHKTIGHLDHVLIHPQSREITHLVIRRGLIPQRLVLPVEQVEDFYEDEIFTSISNDELDRLPRYSPPEEAGPALVEHLLTPEGSATGTPEPTSVVARVQAALSRDPRTQNAVIEVIDDRGVIILQGDVQSPEMRQAAEEVAAAQPGVTSVVNELMVIRS